MTRNCLDWQSPSESSEQRALINWARLRSATMPELGLLYSIPNGGARDVVTGKRMKDEGVKKGVPDLCLPVPRGGFHGLYIELKRIGTGRVSKEQNWWLERLAEQGYRATVCFGFDDARRTIEKYLCSGNSGIGFSDALG